MPARRNKMDSLKLKRLVRQSLRICFILFLLWLAWNLILGAVRQFNRSRTTGQKVETIVQLQGGFLSLLVILTSFRWQRWAGPVRIAWGGSLVTVAGLSALVWGPPMPLVAVLFSAVALLIAQAVIWVLSAFPIASLHGFVKKRLL